MTENPKDPDKFTPTDWDWVMFLSGEINAIETRFDTFCTTAIATLCAFVGFIIVCLIFQMTYPGYLDIDIFVVAIIFVVAALCVFLIYMKKKREAKKMVKSLKKCREDIFNRLGDPNKILECYLNVVGKKGDKNK